MEYLDDQEYLEDPAADSPADDESSPAAGDLAPSQPRLGWPDLIVDIGGADLYERGLAAAVGHPSPVMLDVTRLLASGAASALQSATAVLFAATDGGLPVVEPIERLRARAPHVGIYVLAPDGAEVQQWAPLYSISGVDEVLAMDDPARVDRHAWTLRQRLTAPAPETEMRLLWRWFRESPERSLVLHCVRNAYWADNWALRASVFAASRRTLQNRLSSRGLPSPGLIARCGRILHAQELERRGVKPARDVATILGMPSAAALLRGRRRVRRTLLARGPSALVFASLLR